jgi:hypothetical protein
MEVGNEPLKTIKGALAYYTIRLQLNVIPLHDIATGHCSCGDLHCGKNSGKHPRIMDWRRQASKKFDKIFHDWWARWPNANIGIPAGKTNGFFALDIDDVTALEDLLKDGRDWPLTYSYQTGSGNRHYWFKYPESQEITNSRGKLPLGIDVRGNGGYLVVPPSVSGVGAYVLEALRDVAEAPSWLLDMLRPVEGEHVEYAQMSDLVEFDRLDDTTQERYRRYTNSVVRDEIEGLHVLASDPNSQWDNSTYKTSCNLFELAKAPWSPLTSDQVEDVIREHAPPFDHEGWTEIRLNKIITSAYKRIMYRDGARPYPPEISIPPAPDKRSPPSEHDYSLVRFSEIEDIDYAWFEENWIPKKGVVLLVGDSSSGKSTLFAHWAAKASTGKWGTDGPLNCLFFSEEDSAGAIIKPRLVASGADLTKIMTVKIREPDAFENVKERSVNFKHHLDVVRKIIIENQIRVIFIDPAPKFLGVDEDRDSKDMQRTVLENISAFADELDLLIIMIKHNKKHQKASDALTSNDRTYGSVVWTEVPRHKLSLMKVDHELRDKFDLSEDDPVAALLKIDKNSYGPDDIPKKAFRRDLRMYRGHEVAFLIDDGHRKISSRDMDVRPVETDEQTDRRKDISRKSDNWLMDMIKANGGSILRTKLEEICGQNKNPSFSTIKRRLRVFLDEGKIIEERRDAERNRIVIYYLADYDTDPMRDLE